MQKKFEMTISIDLNKRETRVSKVKDPLFDLMILAEGMGVLMKQAQEQTGNTKEWVFLKVIDFLEQVKGDYEKTKIEQRKTTFIEKIKFILSKIFE